MLKSPTLQQARSLLCKMQVGLQTFHQTETKMFHQDERVCPESITAELTSGLCVSCSALTLCSESVHFRLLFEWHRRWLLVFTWDAKQCGRFVCSGQIRGQQDAPQEGFSRVRAVCIRRAGGKCEHAVLHADVFVVLVLLLLLPDRSWSIQSVCGLWICLQAVRRVCVHSHSLWMGLLFLSLVLPTIHLCVHSFIFPHFILHKGSGGGVIS